MTDPGSDPANWVMPFPGTTTATIEDAGGKGFGLIRLVAHGFDVPPGVVLGSRFFDSWIAVMVTMPEWRKLPLAPAAQRAELCAGLKHVANRLPLHDGQHQALASLSACLARQACSAGTSSRGPAASRDGSGPRPEKHQIVDVQPAPLPIAEPDPPLFAVRSSSTQEDRHGMSFAGGFATRLGVTRACLVDAIRECFASAFDERVFAYLEARGLALDVAQIAVVVQQQIASESSGVAFSLNPLSNDFDEAVIDANWGLGETVVAGEVSPDHWVLNKLDGAVIEARLGTKHNSRWLEPDGRHVDRPGFRSDEPCLNGAELGRLLDLVRRVEAAFGHPVDIEWALADGRLHLLQARPVTAFVPLAEKLVSPPGAPRRLYIDLALSSGLTINAPISAMGLDVFRRLVDEATRLALGPVGVAGEPSQGPVIFEGSRMYLDFSSLLWVTTPARMADSMKLNDATIARILQHVDARRYRAPERPAWARVRNLSRLPGALWRRRRMLYNSVLPFVMPQRSHRRICQQLDAFENALSAPVDRGLPLPEYWQRQVGDHLETLFDLSLAVIAPAVLAVQVFTRLAEPVVGGDDELRAHLDRGFEGNVVVDMSVRMARLAQQVPPPHRGDMEWLRTQLANGGAPEALREEWSGFLARHGCRGPLEMDIAHPRYADAPDIALRQIAAMPITDPERAPAAAAARQVAGRRTAAATVMRRTGPIRHALLRRLHAVIENFSGMRDTPKLHLLVMLQSLRHRLLDEGGRLHDAGRIDDPAHVFDLHLDELACAGGDARQDLRPLIAARRAQRNLLAAQVRNFPQVIDSRGRILRPPASPQRPGAYVGVGLSPGVVSGPARTLRSPHDKPLAKGDVLIAYTTDPGWTPLFANAAAVVLEIGGALQHGAVVARELGLPCVAGIDGITTAIADGQLVQVDGLTGEVRPIGPPACAAGIPNA